MRYVALSAAVLVVSIAAATTIQPPEPYPTEPDEAVALYQFARNSLQATRIPVTTPSVSPAEYVGRAVEVIGSLAGRVTINAQDAARRSVLVRLRLRSGQTIVPRSSSFITGLQDEDRIHAILEVPSTGASQPRFILRAIVREYDLPRQDRVPMESSQAAQAGADPLQPTAGPGVSKAGLTPGAADLALPPELRQEGVNKPRLAYFTMDGKGLPRPGKQGAWDPAGDMAYPVISQAQLDAWIPFIKKENRHLTDAQADWIVRWVVYYSARNGVDHRLMFAMIKCESSFKPTCISHAGAIGLTQLMPCNLTDYKVTNKWNVQEQLRAGIKHFKDMLDLWKGRSNYEQFALGAASYNAGPNAVKRAGGVPNYKETRNYVKKLGDLFYKLVKSGYP